MARFAGVRAAARADHRPRACCSRPASGAAHAASDPARCAGSPYSPEGSQDHREFIDLPPELLPPAMRALEATCVSKLADEPFDNDGIMAAYNAIYLDMRVSAAFVGLPAGPRERGLDLRRHATATSTSGDRRRCAALTNSSHRRTRGARASSGQTPWLVQSAFTRPGVNGGPSSMFMQWSDGEHSRAVLRLDHPAPGRRHAARRAVLGRRHRRPERAAPRCARSTSRSRTVTQAAVIGGSAVMLTLDHRVSGFVARRRS